MVTEQGRGEGFARSALQVVGGNVAGSALMAVLVVVLPRYLSMANYGYWQLYFFYAAYLGYLSFGLADGIFLRFSGARFEDIPRSVVAGHFRALLLIAVVTFGTGAVLAWVLVPDQSTKRLIALVCLSTIFYLLRSLLTFAHQAANRMELYAKSTILERSVSLVIVVLLLVAGYRGLLGFLWADVVGRGLGLVYVVVSARRLVFAPRLPLTEDLREIRESFRGGIFVSIAAIAAVLVTAMGRFSAERGFGIEVFGQVALAFSLVNIVQTVVAPISLAVLPNIRRYPREHLPGLYSRGLDLLMPLLVLALLVYVPLAWAVTWWLPAYTLLPAFLAGLLPMVIFESRTRLFAIPFLQGLRRERMLAAVNVASLALAAILAWTAVVVLNSAEATVLSVTVSVVVRSLALEWAASRAMGLAIRGRTLAELGVSVVFVVAAGSRLGVVGWAVFAVAWAGYLWWSRTVLRGLLARLLVLLGHRWHARWGREGAPTSVRPRAGILRSVIEIREASPERAALLGRVSAWLYGVGLSALVIFAIGAAVARDPGWGYALGVLGVSCLWAGNVAGVIGRWRTTFLLIGFHLALALFLLANPVISALWRIPFTSAPEQNGAPKALWLMALSLVALRIGGEVVERRYAIADGKPEDVAGLTNLAAQRILFAATLVTLAVNFVSNLGAWLFVRSHSYVEYYTSYSSPLPWTLDIVGAAAGAMVACYLAQFARGRSHLVVLGGFAVTALPQLAMGLRSPFIEALVLAGAYILLRWRRMGGVRAHLPVAAVVFVAIALPLGMAGLGALNYARYDKVSTSGLDPVTDFVYSQSVSFSVVARGLELYQHLPGYSSKEYSVGFVTDYVMFGKPSQILFHVQPLGGNTVRHATAGHEFSHAFSYYLYGQDYLKGRGSGSSYLVETFIDGGPVLVAVFSVLVGALLIFLSVGHTGRWFRSAVLLIMLPLVFLIPRANATGFLLPFVLPHFWLAVGFTFAVRWAVPRLQRRRTSLDTATPASTSTTGADRSESTG